MNDLKFDINKMDLVVENGDFVLSDNLSEQNGALFLITKNSNLYFPTQGVGIAGAQGSNTSGVNFLLSKWKNQVIADGSKTATAYIDDNNEIVTTCDYE